MTLLESIKEIADMIVMSGENGGDLQFFIDIYGGLLCKQVEEYLGTYDNVDIVLIQQVIADVKPYVSSYIIDELRSMLCNYRRKEV